VFILTGVQIYILYIRPARNRLGCIESIRLLVLQVRRRDKVGVEEALGCLRIVC